LGDSIATAMEKTFLKSGKGIITGGLTTAFAFLTLIISSSRGMKEMGIVTGVGLLAILVATFLFLPVMLVFRERRIDKKHQKQSSFVQRDITFKNLGQTSVWLSNRYAFTILASIIITILLIWSASNISFMILTDNVDQSRELSEKYRDMGTVAMTEDISLYLPSYEQQEKRKPHIEEIYKIIKAASIKNILSPNQLPNLRKEIERLEMNIMEMQTMAFLGGQDKVDNKCTQIVGDPENPASKNMIRDLLELLNSNRQSLVAGLSKFQRDFAPYFKESVVKMCSTELVDDLESGSDKVTGFPPVFRALVDIIGRDGRNAALLTLVIIFLLLWFDFGSVRYALMAMIPLAAGMLWMIGLMHLTGQQLTVMNVMGLPMILGIGIDDGVHIVHRWQNEGKGKIHTVFASTGKAILLTSLTTMLAFGSLTFSIWRGFGQLGAALFVGVGACFLTTVIILSGLIGLIERNRNK